MTQLIDLLRKFNDDVQVNHLRYLYEKKSLLDLFSVPRRELSHSAFLTELLKEDSFHKMGTLPLQLFLEAVLHRAIQQKTHLLDYPQTEVMFPSLKSAILTRTLSLSDIDVDKEVFFADKNGNSGRVDILATCKVKSLPRDTGKDVEFINIIIENKIYAKEQDSQTDKYYQHFNAFLKNNAGNKVDISGRKGGPRSLFNLYVYLTPASQTDIDRLTEPESQCKECVQICYQDILDFVIDPLLKSPELSHEGRFVLEGYRRSLGVSFDDVEIDTRDLHNQPKFKKTIIMAVSKKEREELIRFWQNHKTLLIAAINEKNRVSDEDIDEDGGKKRTLYAYKKQPFTMGRLVQAVISDHLEEYKMDEINGLFKDVVGCGIVSLNNNKSYFEEEEEPYTKDLVKVHVFRQWTTEGQYKFDDFCEKTKQLGWYTKEEYQEKIPSPEESMVLVDFYDKHKELITTTLEILKQYADPITIDEVTPLLNRTSSHRDRTTYDVTLLATNKPTPKLSWGKLVLTILKDYISLNECDLKGLDKIFGVKKALKKYCSDNKKGFSGHFSNPEDVLSLKEGQYVVKISWSPNDLEKFIEAASEVGYSIVNSSDKLIRQ